VQRTTIPRLADTRLYLHGKVFPRVCRARPDARHVSFVPFELGLNVGPNGRF
jgi:hypothetical protein